MIQCLAWPLQLHHTMRNRYSCDSLLSTCIVLRQLAYRCQWRDLEEVFGKHASQLSEIIWEGLEHFLDAPKNLLLGTLSSSFVAKHAERYAKAIKDKSSAMRNCIGFIDVTVIGIAILKGYEMQRVCYSGHKQKHALKIQAVSSPDGLIFHVFGPIEGRHHDWTLHRRSGLDEMPSQSLVVDGRQYAIYGDSGYK